MINTTNYNLNKFEDTDKFSKDYINANFDIIDVAIGDLQETFSITDSGGALTTQEVIEARGVGNDVLVDRLNKSDEQMADIVQQNYYKTISKPYNGFNMYVPFSNAYGTYQTIIDKAVELGSKCINICPRLTFTAPNTITISTNQSDLVNVIDYARSKGLIIFLKPHIFGTSSWSMYSTSGYDFNTWFTNYSTALLTVLGWVASKVDIAGVSNELYSQTSVGLSSWQSLIASMRALNVNMKISCSMVPDEISTNAYLPYIDYIGCNLYIGLNGDLNTNVSDLKKCMFREYTSNLNYIDILHKKAQSLNKKIFITETGLLPMINSIKQPAKWDYDNTYYQANKDKNVQLLYYKAMLPTYANDSLIDGIMLWSLTDDFTPIGNLNTENLIKTYFGGDV